MNAKKVVACLLDDGGPMYTLESMTSQCPFCGKTDRIIDVTARTEVTDIQNGAPCLCAYCRELSVMDASGTLVKPTPDQVAGFSEEDTARAAEIRSLIQTHKHA